MSERLLDVVSEISENGQPFYGNCSVFFGDAKIEFRSGRAKCPESVGGLVARDPHITVYAAAAIAPATVAPAPLVDEGEDEDRKTPADLVGDEDAVALAEEYLREEGEEVPEREVETLTSDGMERCTARIGNGTQCINKATSGNACGLPAHRKQVGASLAAA